MRTDRPSRLLVELQACGLSVRGHVFDELGRELPFAGWLGLLGLLDRAIAPAGGPNPRTSQRKEIP